MRRKRTKLAPGRLAAVIVCALLAAAVLWGALGLVVKLTHYGESSTINVNESEEETPGHMQQQPTAETDDGLIPGLAVNSYDAARSSNLEQFRCWYLGLLEQGIYAAPSQFEAMFLCNAHTDEEVERIIECAGKIF